MESIQQSEQSFGEAYFGKLEVGDKRRTKRLVALVDSMAQHPGGSFPQKLRKPADLVALYRLCARREMTHQLLMTATTSRVLASIALREGDVLVLHDATELDYTSKKSLKNLGQIGNGGGRGYIVHNSLAVDPARRETIGLVGQILHSRPQKSRPQQRESAARESRLWIRGTEVLPRNRRLIDVADAGADTFEFLEHECWSGRRFVIRSGYQRNVLPGHVAELGERHASLHEFVRQTPPLGGFVLHLQAKTSSRKKKFKDGRVKHPPRGARVARLLVSVTCLRICAPEKPRGAHGDQPLPLWTVRVCEPNPPQGEEPLEWLLFTNVAVVTLAEAMQIVEWYQLRWIIEEYHKALKTGCGIEELHFQSEDRLEPAIALVSVVATTLLKLRDAARAPDAETRPAREIIGSDYVAALSLWRHGCIEQDWSVRQFILALGRLGGHQNRRGDGLPGWITLWRGWTDLVPRVDAIRNYKKQRIRCA